MQELQYVEAPRASGRRRYRSLASANEGSAAAAQIAIICPTD
jgi:hypothetical protein